MATIITKKLSYKYMHFHKYKTNIPYNTVFKFYQISSVTQLCPTLCNPMNRSTPGLPVPHQLLESTQTHVH